MLYSNEKDSKNTFRGKVWKLGSGYWRSCNYNGQQCNFKLYNEALRFSVKGKPVNEDVINEAPADILKRNMTSRSGTGLDRKVFDALKRLQSGAKLSLKQKQWVVKQLQDNIPHTALVKVWRDVRKSSMSGGNTNDGSRTIEAIISAAMDGQKAGLGQAHHGVTRMDAGEDPQQSNRGALPKWARDPKYAKKKYLDKFKNEAGDDRSAFDAIKPGSKVTFRMKRHGVVRGVADRYDKRKDVWHADTLVGDESGIVTRDNFVSLGTKLKRESDLGSLVNKKANPKRCSKCGSKAPAGKATLCKTCQGLQNEAGSHTRTRVIDVVHLSQQELKKLVALIQKQGYHAKARGRYLETDADDQVVHNMHSKAIGTTGGRGVFRSDLK